jgi:hypothetical protein
MYFPSPAPRVDRVADVLDFARPRVAARYDLSCDLLSVEDGDILDGRIHLAPLLSPHANDQNLIKVNCALVNPDGFDLLAANERSKQGYTGVRGSVVDLFQSFRDRVDFIVGGELLDLGLSVAKDSLALFGFLRVAPGCQQATKKTADEEFAGNVRPKSRRLPIIDAPHDTTPRLKCSHAEGSSNAILSGSSGWFLLDFGTASLWANYKPQTKGLSARNGLVRKIASWG